MSVCNWHRRGLLFVLSSPSGAGKSTICKRLLGSDSTLSMSLSATTRSPRPGEIDGVHYRFLSDVCFQAMIQAGEFLEHAEVFGNRYGTPRAPVEAALHAGHDVLFDIDWQGTQQLHEAMGRDLVRVFILPPTAHELARRLYSRAEDAPQIIAQRMAKANDEMSHWAEYDYVIVNQDLENAVAKIQAILQVERLKRCRQVGLSDFVKGLQQVP